MMRSKRFEKLAQRPVNRETFIQPWSEVGLMAIGSPLDPVPGLKIAEGNVVERAMNTDSREITRILMDINVSRAAILELASGCTAANQAHVTNRKEHPPLLAADAAEAAGYWQLAENMRRAAELTHLSNEEVLDIYNTLRPGRATYGQLIRSADRLETELDAPLTAALVREAAEVYLERGISDYPREIPRERHNPR